MASRSSSLNRIDPGVSREIGSQYANVRKVADNIESVVKAATMDLDALSEAILEAVNFEGLSVEAGEVASWNPTTKVITVPTVKGDKGDDGESITISSIAAEAGGTFRWIFSDGTEYITPSLKGSRGDKGDTGDQGDSLTMLSVTAGPNGTFVWHFSDGSSYSTPSLTGLQGPRGEVGEQGPKGDPTLITEIISEGAGVFLWKFSDGTVYRTPSLQGEKGNDGPPGIRGEQGVSVHHLRPTSTTEIHGHFGHFGEHDTYTFYGDADENWVLGYFTVMNGVSSAEELEPLGVMFSSTYDTDNSGVVDNSERLGGDTLEDVHTHVSNVADTKVDKTGGTISGDLTVSGNLVVSGDTTTVHTEDLQVKDNLIVLNDGEAGAGVSKVTAGIRVDRGLEVDSELVFDETTDSWRAGLSGATLALAAREDSPTNGALAVWDSTTKKFVTTPTSTPQAVRNGLGLGNSSTLDVGTVAGTVAAGDDTRLSNSREWTATVVPQAEAEAGTATTARKWTSQRVRQAILGWWNTSAFKTKLDGIAEGATANQTNAHLLARTNHTGVQPISTVTDLQPALDNKVDVVAGKQLSTEDFTTPLKTKLDGIATGAQVNVATNLAQGTRTATTVPITSSTGSSAVLAVASTTLAGVMSSADKVKLNGVATSATANQTDAHLLSRANHTGTQAATTITGLSDVATSNDYNDLDNLPALGTAAGTDSSDYATAAQGGLAGSAVQPSDLSEIATSGQASDVSLVDAGNYYTSADVEGALQEIGLMLGDVGSALDVINGEVV